MATSNQYGAFVPTTNVWDIANLGTLDVNSPEFKELLIRLYQNINNISMVLNIKDTGMYQLSEFVNGQLFFSNPAYNSSTIQGANNRQVIRKVINFGTLPNNATTSVPHGIFISANTTFTRIYGCASDTTGLTYLPLPFPAKVANMIIELDVDATNVNITTGTNRTNYNICYVVLEFLQD